MKVVLDTNVIVSAILTPKGTAAKAVGLVSSGTLIPCYDLRILDEYQTVLLRAKFSFDKALIFQFLTLIQDVGLKVISEPSAIDLHDESDRKFYDTAKVTSAYLVTGNTKHFPKEDWILTPAEIVRLFTN